MSRLVKIVSKSLGCSQLKVVFCSPCKLDHIIHFEDTLQKNVCSFLVYRYTCSQQMGVSNLTEKRINNLKPSAVSDQTLECDCSIDFGNCDILTAESSIVNLLIKENLLIKHDKSMLRKQFNHSPY